MRAQRSAHTVSHVVRSISESALAAGRADSPLEAGLLGPWRIAAEEIDPVDGTLQNFRVQGGNMMITARSARIIVDADRDAFSFELDDLVFVRVPTPAEPERTARIHRLEHYVLGPAPYGMEIVPDGSSAYRPIPGEPLGP
jgi:hypothetical protein